VNGFTLALDVGGTHVEAALVDVDNLTVADRGRTRVAISELSDANVIFESIAVAACSLSAHADGVWAISIPGPFDYRAGVGHYRGRGKFECLDGVKVWDELRNRIRTHDFRMVFLNDAEAFLLGELALGTGIGHQRVVGITLGSGIGSAFTIDGRVVRSGNGIPEAGAVSNLSVRGKRLEDVVSRSAILRAFGEFSMVNGEADLSDIAEMAREGNAHARSALVRPLETLGEVLAPWLRDFGAELLIVGGGMSNSWDLVAPAIRKGLSSRTHATDVKVVPACSRNDAALIGAALHANDHESALADVQNETIRR
jgi:glucokinase